jgi:hypothetical protein
MLRKRLIASVAVLAAMLLITGCADTWVKPGSTEQEFEATKAECLSRAAARFPPMYQQVQIANGYTTPVNTTCNGFGGYSVNCSSTGGQYVPPAVLNLDANVGARREDTRSCFFENGWHLKTASDSTTYVPTPPTPEEHAMFEARGVCGDIFPAARQYRPGQQGQIPDLTSYDSATKLDCVNDPEGYPAFLKHYASGNPSPLELCKIVTYIPDESSVHKAIARRKINCQREFAKAK